MIKRLLIFGLMPLALWLAGCGGADDSADSADQAQVGSERPTEGMARVLSKPSGIRYQDLVIGDGTEIVDSMYVKHDYSIWFSDESGMNKVSPFASSKGTANLKYHGQVGVTPIEGLSDGLRGMRVGGIRRIFIPWKLGYGAEGPYAKTNLIFEVENLEIATIEEYSEFQAKEQFRREYYQRREDSIRYLKDSLGIDPDSSLPMEMMRRDPQ